MGLRARKNQRLQGYDYHHGGMFFITICTKEKHNPLGMIAEDSTHAPQITLSDLGKIVKTEIEDIPTHYIDITLDKYVVMPNHLHLILQISEQGSQEESRSATTQLSTVITMLKKRRTRSAVLTYGKGRFMIM